MKTTKLLRNILAGATLFACTTFSKAEESNPITGNVKYFQGIESNNDSYPEVNAFYTIPGNINGYTYIDRFRSGFILGETSLDKKIEGNLNAAVQIRHTDELISNVTAGIKYSFDVKNGYGSINFMPLEISKDGRNTNQGTLDFAAGKFFSNGIAIETFGGWRYDWKSGEIQWDYGEVNATVPIKKNSNWKVGFMPALVNKGNKLPKIVPRVGIQFDF